ncbi:MAG: hypothetical protein WA624_01185, partial [Methylocella sp.]
MNAPEVKLFADAIVTAGGFDRDHTGHAADAAEAHRRSKHSYGYKTIAEIFGEKVAGKAAEWLGYKSDSDGAAYANGEDDDCDDLVEATKADPTAPLLPEAVKRLVALQKADLAEFARVRSKLKDAGCPLAMLDKAIARAAKQAQAKKGNGATGDGSFGFRMTPTLTESESRGPPPLRINYAVRFGHQQEGYWDESPIGGQQQVAIC